MRQLFKNFSLKRLLGLIAIAVFVVCVGGSIGAIIAYKLTLPELSMLLNAQSPTLFKDIDAITGDEKPKILQESFVLVRLENHVSPHECLIDLDHCPLVSGITATSRGSGAVIGHGLGTSYVLTAAHVCRHEKAEGAIIGGIPYSYSYVGVPTVVDYYGNHRDAMIIDVDEENDLCLMLVPGIWGDSLKIADKMVPKGSRVFNIAAPLGIFSPGMVLIFDGYYSGEDHEGDVFFTIPARPGSSGSPVISENGEVVGVLHSVATAFNTISLGSKLSAIQELINKNQSLFK